MFKLFFVILIITIASANAQKGHAFKNPYRDLNAVSSLDTMKDACIALVQCIDDAKINFHFNVRTTKYFTKVEAKKVFMDEITDAYGKSFTDAEAINLIKTFKFKTPSKDFKRYEIARFTDDGKILWSPRPARFDLGEMDVVGEGDIVLLSNVCYNPKRLAPVEEDQSAYIEKPTPLTNKKEEVVENKEVIKKEVAAGTTIINNNNYYNQTATAPTEAKQDITAGFGTIVVLGSPAPAMSYGYNTYGTSYCAVAPVSRCAPCQVYRSNNRNTGYVSRSNSSFRVNVNLNLGGGGNNNPQQNGGGGTVNTGGPHRASTQSNTTTVQNTANGPYRASTRIRG